MSSIIIAQFSGSKLRKIVRSVGNVQMKGMPGKHQFFVYLVVKWPIIFRNRLLVTYLFWGTYVFFDQVQACVVVSLFFDLYVFSHL